MAKKNESSGRTSERSAPAASHAARMPDSGRGTTTVERGKEKLGEIRDSAVDAASDWASDARDAVSTAARRTQETIGPVAESVRQNPWPALLVGAGLTWLIVDSVRGQDRSPRYSRGTSNDNVWRFVKQNPLLAGVTAVGLGVAFSMALPETDRENELLGDTRDAVVDRAKELARGTVDAAQSVADSVQQIAGRS